MGKHVFLQGMGYSVKWEKLLCGKKRETRILMFPGLLPFKLRMGGEETLFRFYYMIY